MRFPLVVLRALGLILLPAFLLAQVGGAPGVTPPASLPPSVVGTTNLIAGTVAVNDRIKIVPIAKGAGQFDGTLSTLDLTAARAWNLPNAGGTIALTTDVVAFTGGSVANPITLPAGTGAAKPLAWTSAPGTGLFLPDQTNFAGTLYLGTGGANLTHGGGTEGGNNTFVGLGAGDAVTSGSHMVGIGFGALNSDTGGYSNIAIGPFAMGTNGGGHHNVAIGPRAMQTGDGMTNDVAIGDYALYAITSGGAGNTAIGSNSGYYSGLTESTYSLTTGSYNTFIGFQSGLGSATQRSNSTVLGANAYVDASNTVVLGDENVTTVLAGSATQATYVGHFRDPSPVTPLNAKAGTATIAYVNSTDVTATKIVTVNGQAYTFVAVVAVDYDVKVDGVADNSWTNLKNAIDLTAAPGVGDNQAGGKYKVPLVHPTVSAAINTGTDTVTLTAKTKGAAGNALTLTSDEATATVTAFATLATGVDGTVGVAGDVKWDTGFIYVCTATNTIADANWKRATLAGSF